MSRLNHNRIPLNASGLSRQSTKFYKTVRQRSNTELDKTLKKLNIEHKASISKILQEEYALKNDHHAMRRPAELFPKGKQPSYAWTDCGHEDEQLSEEGTKVDSKSYAENMDSNDEGEKNGLAKMDSRNKSRGVHAKPSSCHLPSIMEETTLGINKYVCSQSTRSGRSENTLPPLFENSFPMLPRVHSDQLFERQPGRNRSKTISIPDETRGRHYMARKRSNVMDYGGIACDPKRKDFDSQSTAYTSQGWDGGRDEGLASCRYLRKSHSSPNVLDAETFFK